MNLIDFKHTFDTVDRNVLWKILKQYGIPNKFLNIIKTLYDGFQIKIVHNGMTSDPIVTEAGVRQGCILSQILLLIAMDWIMKRTSKGKTGIQWNVFKQLEDLEFADDICLISHKFEHMQEKTNKLSQTANRAGLKINNNKTKYMTINMRSNKNITVDSKAIEKVQKFTYLESIVDAEGGAEADVNQRIGKAQQAFHSMKKIWKSNISSLKHKLRIFNTNVKSILLYGCETWKTNKNIINRLQVFVNKCIRRILRIWWPNKTSNKQLWERTKQETISNCSSTLKDLQRINRTWTEAKFEAQNRIRWRKNIEALCSTGREED